MRLLLIRHADAETRDPARWPDDSRQSRVVFITRNISEQHVRELLEALRKLV